MEFKKIANERREMEQPGGSRLEKGTIGRIHQDELKRECVRRQKYVRLSAHAFSASASSSFFALLLFLMPVFPLPPFIQPSSSSPHTQVAPSPSSSSSTTTPKTTTASSAPLRSCGLDVACSRAHLPLGLPSTVRISGQIRIHPFLTNSKRFCKRYP